MKIADWRTEIDNLDNELLRLLNQRAKLATRIGKLKRAANLPLCDEDRERALVARLRHVNAGPLDDRAVAVIFQQIIRETRRAEARAVAPEAESAERVPQRKQTGHEAFTRRVKS
jgi:chorismate mutase